MKLFETGFYDKNTNKWCERVFDTETKESDVLPLLNQRYEFAVIDPEGAFTGFIDNGVRYSIANGSYKDAKDQPGACSPLYRNIRDNYVKTGNFNTNPRIWYLDIETRSGVQFVRRPNYEVYVKENDKITKKPVHVIQDIGYTGEYSTNGRDFAPITNAPFMAKTPVFPKPELAQHQVTLIQIYDNVQNTVFIIGLKQIDTKRLSKVIPGVNIKYIQCETEEELLLTFGKLFRKLDPLIILAWNGNGFDFPYLFNRMSTFGLEDYLSNYGVVSLNRDNVNSRPDRNIWKLDSPGHYFMDFMEIYKKFCHAPRPSYALDAIAEIELKKNKVRHNEFLTFDSFYTGDGYQPASAPYEDPLREEIRQAYLNNSPDFHRLVDLQFVVYGVYDVVLLKALDDKLKFIPLMNRIASVMGVLLGDTLRTVKPWSQYIANEAHFIAKVLPAYEDHDSPSIVGGFVKDPVPGVYDWVMNADVNSMYPRLCITAFNMSPETYVPLAEAAPELRDAVLVATKGIQDETLMLELDKDYQHHLQGLLEKYNMSMGINGALFRRDDVGLIPKLVSQIYFQRKKTKQKMLTCYNLVTEINKILAKRGENA